MHTKLLLPSLLLAFGFGAGAQSEPKEVPLKPEFVPYNWIMMPTSDFFALTGLTAKDSISQNAYMVGDLEREHVMAYIEHVDELGIDVVAWVEYLNFKNKAMQSITTTLQRDFALEQMGTEDSVWYQYFTPEAYVEAKLTSASKKTSNLLISGYQLYQFMPPLEHLIAKLDSTHEQLLANVHYGERSVRHDSDGYMVSIRDLTPLVSYGLMYPHDPTENANAYLFLNDEGGQEVLRWAVKKYYDMYFDEYEGSTYWVKDTDKDRVGLGFLLPTGAFVHRYITQEEYQEWAQEGDYLDEE